MKSLDLARTALLLKEVRRSGWERAMQPGQAESVADHSWSVALLAALLCPPELDREKLLIMAILHDLAELRVGDITPHDGITRERKRALEEAAMLELLEDHPELLAIWHEAEDRRTPEARLLKELDGLDMGLQADRYHALGRLDDRAADEFRASAGPLHPRLVK